MKHRRIWHNILLWSSSFLKQHNDEEAVFKSFRDINELIKDMLEIKGKYGAVETELKEMHERYSQLSLQFAEVEGERQKLMMTLKNIRASRKAQNLIHSSSASLGDHSWATRTNLALDVLLLCPRNELMPAYSCH